MIRWLCFLLYCWVSPSFVLAQSDSIGFDVNWKRVSRDSAYYIQHITPTDSIYIQRVYIRSGHLLYSVNEYKDPALSIRHGGLSRYNQHGQLIDSVYYQNNRVQYWVHFYPDGVHKKNETLYQWEPQFKIASTHAWTVTGEEALEDSFYYDRFFRFCLPDTAAYMEVLKFKDAVWETNTYSSNNNQLLWKRFYKDRYYQIPTRYYAYYLDERIRDSMVYDSSGKQTELWKFHRNGQLSAVQYYAPDKKSNNSNWDEDGKAIGLTSKVQPAAPKEPFKSWQRKLLRQMNQDDRIPWERRKNWYGSVFISFWVTDEGKMKDVLIKQPSLYPEMDALILAYCKQEDNWEPCRIWGRRENFVGTHSFSFVAGKVIRYETLY